MNWNWIIMTLLLMSSATVSLYANTEQHPGKSLACTLRRLTVRMVQSQVSASISDGILNPLYCVEEIQDTENPPNGHANQDIKQVSTYITPWKHNRLAAVSLALLAAVLLIVDIGLGVHYRDLKDTHLTGNDTERIGNELTKLQDTYQTAIKTMNDYKKQLDAEKSNQTETNWEFEHQTRRSRNYELQVTKMTQDIAALRYSTPMIVDGCKHCPPGWILMNSVCYYFSFTDNPLLRTWQRARDYCQFYGGDLAVIDSKDKEKSIVTYINKKNGNPAFWIGLKNPHETLTWTWVDGRILVEGYWKDGEPNNPTDDHEDCAGVYSTINFFKAWNDLRCDNRMNWICEKVPLS